jgi:hypothetical protein
MVRNILALVPNVSSSEKVKVEVFPRPPGFDGLVSLCVSRDGLSFCSSLSLSFRQFLPADTWAPLLQPTHVGPLRFSAIESREKHDAPVTPLIPIIGFVIAIYLFAKYTNVQSYANGGSAPNSSPGSFLSPGVLTRAKAREAGRVEEPSPVVARKPLVRRPRTSTY